MRVVCLLGVGVGIKLPREGIWREMEVELLLLLWYGIASLELEVDEFENRCSSNELLAECIPCSSDIVH